MKNLVKVLFIVALAINAALTIYGLVTLNLALWIPGVASLILLACYYVKTRIEIKQLSENVCVACGKNEAEPNSHICTECKRQIEG